MSSYEIQIEVPKLSKPPKNAASVIEVAVLQDVSAPGMFEMRLTNWGESNSDADLFSPGNKVEIWMEGEKGNRQPVMTGEITGLEPEFRSGEPMTVTVRGHDPLHRLMRGRKTRTWVAKKDSEIANELAKEAGLEPGVGDTGDILEYVIQYNQTDLEFLQTRAGRLGREVMVEGKALKFHERRENASQVLTLGKGDLEEFSPRLSTIGLVGKAIVQGWSARNKDVITGEAPVGDNRGLEAYKDAQVVIVDQPLQSEAEAQRIALARLREMALSYITGRGVAKLNPALKAGTVVEIQGCGTRFSGRYYLTSVRHTCSTNGYRTAFTVQRNAAS